MISHWALLVMKIIFIFSPRGNPKAKPEICNFLKQSNKPTKSPTKQAKKVSRDSIFSSRKVKWTILFSDDFHRASVASAG